MDTESQAEALQDLDTVRSQMKLFNKRKLSDASGVSETIIFNLLGGAKGCTFVNVRAIEIAMRKMIDTGVANG